MQAVVPQRKAFQDDSGLWLLPLTQGAHAIIDPWSAEFLEQWNWRLWGKPDRPSRYAFRTVSTPFGKRNIQMHRVVAERAGILGIANMLVEHFDTNGLNNRCANLRLATTSDNGCNRPTQSNSATGLKGVFLDKGRYRVKVTHRGQRYDGGYFATPEEAHLAACALRAKLHGEYARD